jgi:hypothetical protein
MPGNLTGIILFITLLFPGYVFERRREVETPDRIRTAFQETLSVVFVGVIADSALLFMAVVFAAAGPHWAPDPVALLAQPASSLVNETAKTAGLLVWVVGGACALRFPRGAGGADQPVRAG